jgi:hypothetical protein
LGLIRRVLTLLWVAGAAVLLLASVASAAIAPPVRIGSNNLGEPSTPAIAVGTDGDAYIVWEAPGTSSPELDFCKEALTSTGCSPVTLPAPDTGAEFFDPPSLYVSGDVVLVFEQVSGGSDDDAVGMDEWVSADGGSSFTMNPDAVSFISGDDAGPDENPVILLPDGLLGFGYNAPGTDPLFQTNTVVSPANYSDGTTGTPPFATINAPSNGYKLTNQTAQFASQLSGSYGVLGVFTAFPGASSSPCPSSAPSALAFAYAPIAAGATQSAVRSELDTNPGTGSAWSTLGEVDCDGGNPAVGGGPAGLGLLETNETSLLDQLVEYRTFTPPSTWGPAVTIGGGESIDGSLAQDSSGGIYATWLDPDTGVTLAYSSTRGGSWNGPVSLLGTDGGEVNPGSLVSSVNGAGVGWAAYSANGVEYAQPFDREYTFTPPTNTSKPTLGGTPAKGGTLSCGPGAWTQSPTVYTYSWYRNGTLLAGVTGPTYKVATLDEGSTIYCVVTASNAGGSGGAGSNSEKIAIKYTKKCPPATGKMTGTQIGLLKLNMTRKRARYVYRRHSSRGFQYKDFFCLTPEGVRAGYATPKLLKTLGKSERKRYTSRVVWASTSDPYYALDGVRAGESITTASALLHTEKPLHIGKNYWYLAVKKGYTAVLKVRGIQVQELGIVDNSLTKTRAEEGTLMHSFY